MLHPHLGWAIIAVFQSLSRDSGDSCVPDGSFVQLSYALSMRMIQEGLSIEASMGLLSKGEGEIRLDRLGRVL